MNKKLIILIVIFFCLVIFIGGITYYYNKNILNFSLIGEENIDVKIFEDYIDPGFYATSFGKDISENVTIDLSGVDTEKFGVYEVTYEVNYKNKVKKMTRLVTVKDYIDPKIKINGKKNVIIELGEEYKDEGAVATDNFDEKVTEKIQIISDLNIDRVGAYKIKYIAADESGNKAEDYRMVYVVEDKDNVDIDQLFKDDITYMEYTKEGIYLEGYSKKNRKSISVCSSKKECDVYPITMEKDNYFSTYIILNDLKNGKYDLYYDNNERVTTDLMGHHRLAREKLNDKLVSFSYGNDNISIEVSDFKYEYDIVIDPGHGGNDSGAENDITSEKYLNLKQSLYEKERYAAHGLKVLLLRDDLTYGTVMGPKDWPELRRKAYALGYYGSVARLTYSNHHNSNDVKTLMGWEILTPASATKEEMQLFRKIGDAWDKDYAILNDDRYRIYTRNYNDTSLFTKEDNEMYYFTDYYAVLRIPKTLYNFNNFIFEGCYLSNMDDFDYYYNDDNWKTFSEDKIKEVVEYLGKKYIAP